MDVSAVESKRSFCFSDGAAKLFENPGPYIVAFTEENGPDLPYPKVIVSRGETDASRFDIRLANEQEHAARRPALCFDGLPLWPVALLEPGNGASKSLPEEFINSLPEAIQDGLVRIAVAEHLPTAVEAASAQLLAKLVRHSISSDRALVELRRLHEDTQRAFREVEEYVASQPSLSTSLPPVRLPRSHQVLELESGSTAVQRLVASSYRLAAVEIDIAGVPREGGRLIAQLERASRDRPVVWNVDLAQREPGPMVFLLDRVSVEPSAPLTLRLRVDLVSDLERLSIAATAPMAATEYRAQISGGARTESSAFTGAIAHTMHRGLPGTAPQMQNGIRPTLGAQGMQPILVGVRAEFGLASVLSPPRSVVERLGFPIIAEAPGELQVHPVIRGQTLAAVPLPRMKPGSVLRIPVRIAHEEGRKVIARLLYGPMHASNTVLRLLPNLLHEEEDDTAIVGELAEAGVSTTSVFCLSGKDEPTEISLPVTSSGEGECRLYVAVRSPEQVVDFSWFRLRQPRSYLAPVSISQENQDAILVAAGA